MTFVAWVKYTDLTRSNQRILDFAASQSVSEVVISQVDATAQVRISMKDNGGTKYQRYVSTSTSVLQENTWQLFAIVVSSSGSTLYVNGVNVPLTDEGGYTHAQVENV